MADMARQKEIENSYMNPPADNDDGGPPGPPPPPGVPGGPPPPPGFGPPGAGIPALPPKNIPVPKVKMKGFQWKKIPNTKVNNTFWLKAQDIDLNSFHEEIEQMFCTPTSVDSMSTKPVGKVIFVNYFIFNLFINIILYFISYNF